MEVVERVTPGVVQIITPDGGAGSGFIIASDGRVVTNEHLVGGSGRVTVRIPGAGSYEARVLGVDAIADLAIVDIEGGGGFTVLDMGDSDDLSIGEDVVAVGFPLDDMLGNEPTITRGVVSSVRESGDGVEHIQTDAAVNPGSSGGPLFNGEGEVIGVNTFVIRDIGWEGGNIVGINFAVSINEMKERLASLSAGESVGVAPTPEAATGGGQFLLESGELPHDDDGRIESITAFEDARNFTISADFEVPYSESVGDWSVGFLFRYRSRGSLSYVAITQSGRYSHTERRNGESTLRDSGYISNWNRNVGDENKIELVAVEARGWLFVNSEYVSDIDVSGADERGSLEIATGFFAGDEVAGETTKVSEITASALEKIHGPSHGSLPLDDNFIATRYADVDVEFAYASAEFSTPADIENWSAGFVFRKRERKDHLVFFIDSDGFWDVEHAPRSGGDWRDIEEGYSSQIDVGGPILNRLELFYTTEVAVVYANGHRLGVVDIGIDAVPQSGDVVVAYGFYVDDDESAGRYENFVVYGLPTD